MFFLPGAFLILAFDTLAGTAQKIQNPVVPASGFFWYTQQNNNKSIPACSPLQITTVEDTEAREPAVPPFYLQATAPGFLPYTQMVDQPIGSTFTWRPTFPVGTTFMITMVDSAAHAGGAVSGYQIVTDRRSCTANATSESPIEFTVDPEDNPCGEIDVAIKGGKAPYTVTVVQGSGTSNLTQQNNEVTLGNLVSANEPFTIYITDSTNAVSKVSKIITSRLGQVNCQNPTRDSKGGASIGGIVGGVVGGLAVLALIVGAVYYWRKKKSQRKEQAFVLPTDVCEPEVHPFEAQDYTRYLRSNQPSISLSNRTDDRTISVESESKTEMVNRRDSFEFPAKISYK